jgi:hypothetical protein
MNILNCKPIRRDHETNSLISPTALFRFKQPVAIATPNKKPLDETQHRSDEDELSAAYKFGIYSAKRMILLIVGACSLS